MKKKSKESIEPLETPKVDKPEPEELRSFVNEAEQVSLMTRHPGWEILRRDIDDTRSKIGNKLAYFNPKTPEFEEARITYLSLDRLIRTIEDYAENRKRVLELLDKLEHPKDNIVLDVDNG